MRCTCRWFKLTHILCCDPKMPTSYLCILGLVFHNKLPACRASCANPWLKHTCLNQRIVTIMITTDTKHISHTHHCKNQTSPPSINCEHCGTNSLRAANTSNYAVIMKPIRCLWKTTSHVAFQPDSQRQLPAASIRCFLKGWSKKEIQHIHAKCRISMGFVFDLNKKPRILPCNLHCDAFKPLRKYHCFLSFWALCLNMEKISQHLWGITDQHTQQLSKFHIEILLRWNASEPK